MILLHEVNYVLIFMCLGRVGKTDSEQDVRKLCSNLIFSQFVCECNFDFYCHSKLFELCDVF